MKIPKELLERILARGPGIVAIDGRCGCGKSSLGQILAEELGASLFHMDDFYLPFARRRVNWRQIPAGNMDLERFRREVLEPTLAGQPVLYRAYRCPEDRFLETEEIPWRPWAVVEGSYSQHPLLADAYRTKLFVTADPAVQEQRLRRREGDHFAAFREIWIPMEEHYFRTFAIERSADAVLHTDQEPISVLLRE